MGRLVLAGVTLAALLSGCGSSPTTTAPNQTRTVLVDYNHDEFAVAAFAYFPRTVQVRPGDTVEFKQAWTGEPHSVTMGSYVDEQLEPLIDLFERVESTGEFPEGEPEEFENFEVPFAFSDEGLAQRAAQPCYVDAADFDGTYPGDDEMPCPNQTQAPFNGQAIYNSGLIPFEGVGGNTYKVELADDLPTGTYSFFCNVHGPLQFGKVEVKEPGSEIPSASAVAKQARAQAKAVTDPLLESYKAALAGKPVTGGDPGREETYETKGKNLVGVPAPFFTNNTFSHAITNEYVPKSLKAKVNTPVTWTFTGSHTLSFNVPKYFPIFTIADNRKVALNPQAEGAVGWPDRPKPDGGGERDEEGPPPDPVSTAVTWDGVGFHSTGLDYSDRDTFSITFTKAGTYPFACLIHPQMIGKVVIES